MAGSSSALRWGRRYRLLAYALIFAGLVLGVGATTLLVPRHHASVAKHMVEAPRLLHIPSSTKPAQSAIDDYHVAATSPRFIAIPASKVAKARVVALGLMHGGTVATPDNIYDTGWYTGSSKPGQKGAMFIYGHVSSWTAEGVFYNLKLLKPGDAVTITRGDGTRYIYRVVSSKLYPHNHVDMHRVLSPINPEKPGLNLMTCAGRVIKGTSEFSERLVVFTVLVNGGAG